MLRAAIVGLGWWGKTLVNSTQGKSDEITFTVGQTRTPSKAADFCGEKSIRMVDDLDTVLADKDIDAVVLATPHSQHAEQIVRVAGAGKHVFVEKPITLDREGAVKAIEAATKAGVVLAVGFNRRFHPSMTHARERIRSSSFGPVVACFGEVAAKTAPFLPPDLWRTKPEESPAGAMTGMGVHLVDLMIDMLGRVSEVYCVTTRRVATVMDDTTTVLLRFESGATGTLFGSLATATNFRFAVYGSGGLAEITKPTFETYRFAPAPDRPPSVAGHVVLTPEIIETPGFDTLKAELEAFAKAATGGPAYPIPYDDVLHGVEVFEAIVRSSNSGKPEKVG